MTIKGLWDRIKSRWSRGETRISKVATRGRMYKKKKDKEASGGDLKAVGKGKLAIKAKVIRKDGTIEEHELQ